MFPRTSGGHGSIFSCEAMSFPDLGFSLSSLSKEIQASCPGFPDGSLCLLHDWIDRSWEVHWLSTEDSFPMVSSVTLSTIAFVSIYLERCTRAPSSPKSTCTDAAEDVQGGLVPCPVTRRRVGLKDC